MNGSWDIDEIARSHLDEPAGKENHAELVHHLAGMDAAEGAAREVVDATQHVRARACACTRPQQRVSKQGRRQGSTERVSTYEAGAAEA